MKTCKDCHFWTPEEDDPPFGECRRAKLDGYIFVVVDENGDEGTLITRSDFGCNQFSDASAL